MRPKRASTVILATLFAMGIAACGERPQVVEYKKGQYQGKSDTRPWEGGEFKGDKLAWEGALRNRTQAQNEYKRTQ